MRSDALAKVFCFSVPVAAVPPTTLGLIRQQPFHDHDLGRFLLQFLNVATCPQHLLCGYFVFVSIHHVYYQLGLPFCGRLLFRLIQQVASINHVHYKHHIQNATVDCYIALTFNTRCRTHVELCAQNFPKRTTFSYLCRCAHIPLPLSGHHPPTGHDP